VLLLILGIVAGAKVVAVTAAEALSGWTSWLRIRLHAD